MSIMRQITLLAKRDPNRRYVLFLDECWALLKDPVVATFVESAFRLSRSLGGGVFGISQGMSEWTSLPNADAIIQNSSHRILLRQASEDSITKAEEKLTLNQREIAHLRSLQTIKGQYSQQLFHHVVASGGYRSSLVVTRPWPLLYALCTSNPRDKDAKRALAEQGLSFAEVITKFAELYPNGA
jgi:conjugal transfer ATP-binding protein TraC